MMALSSFLPNTAHQASRGKLSLRMQCSCCTELPIRSFCSLNRDSPDESQTAINVRVFPALLQDRSEVLTATSTSGKPNACSRGLIWPFSWHLDALLLSVALECMTSNVSR